ncbi:hypothetical protein CWN94_03780 [Vibrio splendidus]|nr:hypothetical protein CWN94_03780 [Vibrio splendidus]
MFDPLYKKTTLNILNMAHLKFETLPLRRTPHGTNINFFGNAIFLETLACWKYSLFVKTKSNIPTPVQQSHPYERRTTSLLGSRSQTTKRSIAT